MPSTVELLLVENVENTGIVGDVVRVRKGYARNYLLPRGLATEPSQDLIKSLAGKRADAERMLAELRKQREALTAKLAGYELTLIRSCNDQGILYAAITQHDIAAGLAAVGFEGIKDREVRLGQTIKRVDSYQVHIKFEADLDAPITLHVNADRELELRRGDESNPQGAISENLPKPAEGAEEGKKKGKKGDAAATDAGDAKAKKPEADAPAAAAPAADKAEKKSKKAK